MRFKLNPYMLVITSAFLVACSGGKGSFDLDDVQPSTVTSSEKPKVIYKDEETQKREKKELDKLMEPALGYEVKIPRRNRALFDENGNRKSTPDATAELSESQIMAIWSENIDEIPKLKELEEKTTSYLTYHSHDGRKADKTRDLQYVRSGYVYDASFREMIKNASEQVYIFKNGIEGYVYYKGVTPSKELPKGNTINYKGTWDFTSDVNTTYDIKGFKSDGDGKNVAATSITEDVNREYKVGDKFGDNEIRGLAHSSEFTVDFDNKKLTGDLYRNGYVSRNRAQEITKRYSIEADISGNRFRGKASAMDPNDPIFTNSDYLEGGFYGPKAEELAGKFFTNSKSLFAVFAGKRSDEEVGTVRIIDASKIDLTNFDAQELNNFGNANVLIIDGQKMDLVGSDFKNTKTITVNGKTMVAVACCSNLEYTKFGQLWQKDGEKQVKENSLFLQGERTEISQMPVGGNYKYVGTWDASVSSQGSAWIAESDNKTQGYRAEFDVNFSNDKSVKGQLFSKNSIDPTFIIDAQIQGNGFSGTAKTSTSGIQLDSGSSRYDRVSFQDIPVQGGFYGPTAGELGGQFQHKSDNGNVGAVFGAKRQIEQQQ
ncbi:MULTISPECIES: transferrin-binding protein-like solute binding protein [Glaesserella]|uniref:Transferrin-binding protein B n=1 Tax=Glaesserella australis TaxID=2094024 RepID=A0A328BY38_9PAST|nr:MULTISPECIES: transferrin-binding protein-like solute binding protein [Glaesserella]AUI66164.1 transferrin-binding protein [Glaesserella sp. 15-184]RAL19186.1 transferrin-binding protein-like solute binding protein [Glaesserella australis]